MPTSLESLDSLDFRAWLLENGAAPAIVQGSSITALYDTMFQYVDGDVARPMRPGRAWVCSPA